MPDHIQRLPLNPRGPHIPRACIRCFAPDTGTFFIVVGTAEWTAAWIARVAAVTLDEAIGTTEVMRREHGSKPDDRAQANIRLCRTCAAKGGVPIYTEKQLAQGGAFDAAVEPEGDYLSDQ